MATENVTNLDSPSHVAIIMDGNRRWAKSQNLTASDGHRAGFERFKEIVQLCFDKGIKYVTVYAFSTENWKRTGPEVSGLMSLMTYAIKHEIQSYKSKNIQVNVIGRREDLPKSIGKEIDKIEGETANRTENILNVAISYGGKDEIVRAANIALEKGLEITDQSITDHLYTAGQPNPDLIIRTGGEHRLSNFLLWQSDYSELYFTDVLWPDFDASELEQALAFYSNIKRNFGR
jgi:undecaprenyl diphosphate synthase